MVWIAGGVFLMGSNEFYPEEQPAHHVFVEGFWIDPHPATTADFSRFVAVTGYVTVAERPLDLPRSHGADPTLLVPGSLAFQRPNRPVPLHDFRAWWTYVPRASWHHPEGPDRTEGHGDHPVTHIAYEDALAYAHWAGKDLPTEAEWECAARGGLEGAAFVWCDEFAPAGRLLANTWQGRFPWENLMLDGFEGTSPVGTFPPNGFGLYRHGGKRAGVDERLLCLEAHARPSEAMLHARRYRMLRTGWSVLSSHLSRDGGVRSVIAWPRARSALRIRRS